MSPSLLRTIFAAWLMLSMRAMTATAEADDHSKKLAESVTIHRDAWGVAHILGPTDECVIFGMGYAQAEDYFWQVEDTTIRALGRYAEVHGDAGLSVDLLNRSFEVVSRSKADFERLPAEQQSLIAAFTKGLNWYLQRHPETPRQLISTFEPWMVIAIERHLLLDFTYSQTHAGRPQILFDQNQTAQLDEVLSPLEQAARDAIGSNEWAIGPSKTADGKAMLLINPHQPWHGWGQFYEAHLHSEQTIRFSGACFFGTPIPTIGHNEYLGWTYTVNEPDNADAWRVVFDQPDQPLAYRYDDGHRMAVEWTESIGVLKGQEVEPRNVTFRKTHHGPLVRRETPTTYLAANVDGIFDLRRIDQAIGMVRAKNLTEWKAAVEPCCIPMFNVAYADRDGNILYGYNGSIPIRDPQFNWNSPVDGTTSATEWKGRHPFSELPQLLNPACGYVQNCNTSPFGTTHAQNPAREDFPAYMFEDADFQKRRAQQSIKILSELTGCTFEQFQALAFDTRLYWPETQLPEFAQQLDEYEKQNPEAAGRIRPYLQHLLDWDCRATNECTRTALCVAWHEELHQGAYPGETLKPEYAKSRTAQLEALATVAEQLQSLHGKWAIPWGDVHRIQRVHNQSEVIKAAVLLNGLMRSHPCPGVPGPLGVVYTVYSTPSIPVIRPERYGVVGSCYVGVVEFGDRIRAASAVQFGASSNPQSKHYFDQAELFSKGQLKPAWFYPDEVLKHAVRSYHPGD